MVTIGLGRDPGDHHPVRPARHVLRGPVAVGAPAQHRLVEGTDRGDVDELAGDLGHGVEAVLRVPVAVGERAAEGQQAVAADMKGVPAPAGEREAETSELDHRAVRHRRAEVLFPGEGADVARVPAVAVRGEDQRAPVQVEGVGRSRVLGRERHQDLAVDGCRDAVDRQRARRIEGEGVQTVDDAVAVPVAVGVDARRCRCGRRRHGHLHARQGGKNKPGGEAAHESRGRGDEPHHRLSRR